MRTRWLFMRASGLLLVVLVVGHLVTNLMMGDGVQRINFAFVAGKWANPLWQVWSLLLLWLALFHGANGVRTVIGDYSGGRRRVLITATFAAAAVIAVLGSLAILTFDPCPPGAPAELLPAFCEHLT